jgi:hypothetical protein
MESTGPAAPAVLVTGELTKLPPDLQPLMEPSTALPAEVRFFEERKTYQDAIRTLCIGVALIALGIALVFPGVLIAFYAAIVGLVFILGGVLLLGSLRTKLRSMTSQREGQHTRYGVFVTPEAVLVRTELDYALIPREAYHDLQGNTLYYRQADQTKSLNLPISLIAPATPASLQHAVREWAKGAQG